MSSDARAGGAPGPPVIIRADRLGKTYRLYDSPVDRLKEAVHPLRRKYHRDFHALRDVSFEVGRGETVGVIGRNGSGKSTLLKILSGVQVPSSGSVSIGGKVSALLELGMGFNPEMTGVENVYFNGVVMGYSREEMDRRLDAILAFADIGDFARQRVKMYSSGMFVRLAFALAISVDPDILIVDEALAVGDVVFQQKCIRKFEELQSRGATVIFVSHDLLAVKKNCQRVLLLESGELIDQGHPREVIDVYNALVGEKIRAEAIGGAEQPARELASRRRSGDSQRYGTGGAEIVRVELLNADGAPASVFVSGDETLLRVVTRFNGAFEDILVGFTIRNRTGIEVFGTNTRWRGAAIPAVVEGEELTVEFSQRMTLGIDEYLINVAVAQDVGGSFVRLDWISDILAFRVGSVEKFTGLCNLDPSITVTTAGPQP
jgi:ABC-type polysaccharide/polyol phosphate transport system ATPase subunit